MGLRVALLSGGKDSFYAAMIEQPIDLGLILVYQFPRPSPHLLNLCKSIETLHLAGLPTLVVKLRKGREFDDTVSILRKLNTSVIVAGDVYIEDHLKYMERLAGEAGAELREPLWGEDPEELLYREVEAGIEALVIGAEERLSSWLGRVIARGTVDGLVESCRRLGLDPLGERGEYHTIVTGSPLHAERLGYTVAGRLRVEGYHLLKLA
jgi:uncharacterized protein (TIGR00290 family)